MTPTSAPWRTGAALAAILLLGALLRCIGLSWGIPTPELPHRPLHYDENTTMANLAQMDPARGDFNPEWAHIEGTLIFYVWEGVAAILKGAGWLRNMPNGFSGYADPDYGRMMLAGRATIMVFELASIALIFLILLRMGRGRITALLGAALYAVTPMAVINSHFMRPHSAGNTFLLVVILMSGLLIDRRRGWGWTALTGLVVGLTTAARYHLFFAAVIPYTALVYRRLVLEPGPRTARRAVAALVQPHVWLLGACALAGLFLGDPPLFLDFEAARAPLQSQMNASAFGQFTLLNLFDFSKPWKYLVDGLPRSVSWLWIPFYLGTIYALTRRDVRGWILPTLVFTAGYYYYSTKGYGLYAARVLLHIVPIFAIYAALLMGDLWRRASRSRLARLALAILTVCVLAALLFDVAYVAAMASRQHDPYWQVFRYFRDEEPRRELRVGLVSLDWDRYHVPNFSIILGAAPGLHAEVSGSRVDYLDEAHRADYVLLYDFDFTTHDRICARRAELLEGGVYEPVRMFHAAPRLGPLTWDLQDGPTDLLYPFPHMELLRAVPPASAVSEAGSARDE